MPHTNDPGSGPGDPGREAFLLRTRKSVLNVLVAVALLIALSGGLLRVRAEAGLVRPARALHDALLNSLFGVAVASYLVRRGSSRRSDHLPMGRRLRRFYWFHVGAALVAAIGVPLGLAYGWWVDPQLKAVIPFWVVPLALGLLAIPRRAELDDIDPPPDGPEAHSP